MNTKTCTAPVPLPAPSRPSAGCDGQNFATARAAAGPRFQGRRDALEAASRRWSRLLGEPGAWEDPAKRRTLLRARLDYQDALLEAVAAAAAH